jgi:hypothetical protein
MYTGDWIKMIHWVNDNSTGDVDVKFDQQYGQECIYISFEDPDDALFFKIKYSHDIPLNTTI